MNLKRILSIAISALLFMTLLPTSLSATRTPALTVNGVDALTTSSGEGWSYDSASGVLTLNGYNGGSIVASYIDLTVMLAPGTTNVVNTTEEFGIANNQDPYTTPYYSLTIIGSEGSTLNITALNHAVFANGSITLRNLNLTAQNTTTSSSTYEMECIATQRLMTIENCTLNVTTSTGVGITSYDEHSITGSNITVNAGMIGIHANNKKLAVSNSTLNVTGGTAALYSYFGAVYLTSCSGTLNAGTAAIYAQNMDNNYQTELTDCNLSISASYGVMTYSGIAISGGNISIDSSQMGIYCYSEQCNVQALFGENSTITCTETTPQLIQVRGTLSLADTAKAEGIALAYTGSDNTSTIYLLGNRIISRDTSYGRNIAIPRNSSVIVADGVGFDLSSAVSVSVEGSITNNGTLTVNGASTSNSGTITNYGEITLADSTSISNSGKIYSICTSSFDLTPYGENGASLHASLNHVPAVDATHLAEGNIEYWKCADCKKYFSDSTGTNEIAPDDTVLDKAPDHIPDGNGYSYDDNSHWLTCICGAKIDSTAHTLDFVIERYPTEAVSGSGHYECSVCGYVSASVPTYSAQPIPETVVTPSQPSDEDTSDVTLDEDNVPGSDVTIDEPVQSGQSDEETESSAPNPQTGLIAPMGIILAAAMAALVGKRG